MRTSRSWSVGWALGVIAVLAVLAEQASSAEFFFKPKDRILFLGDSITEQYEYTNFIEYYLTTRFPSWDLTFFNAGIGGDTAGGGNGRATRDVLSERPTAVTINFGMNDGGYRAPDPGIYANYIKNQNALVKKLTDAKVRVALLCTSPVEGRKRKDGETYNQTLASFCKGLEEVAAQHGATRVDQFHPALTVLKRMAEDKAPFDCFPDSVHTNSRGGMLMAWAILTSMHAPGVVSELTIGADGKVGATDRCKISGIEAAGSKLAFTRLDDSLPLVLSKEQKQLLPYLDSMPPLNRYGLKVTGLGPTDRYELKIDGKKVADFKGADLGKGIDLALYDLGPITTQSETVWKELTTKNRLLRWRFDNFRRGAAPPPVLNRDELKELADLRARELEVIDRGLASLQKKIYELAQPKPHQFQLTRVE
jgi:lysophospholipase L1-like esterase